MSKERAAKIANSPSASKHGGKKSHSGSGKASQGGTTAQHKAAGNHHREWLRLERAGWCALSSAGDAATAFYDSAWISRTTAQ